jgi:hypothetical protein
MKKNPRTYTAIIQFLKMHLNKEIIIPFNFINAQRDFDFENVLLSSHNFRKFKKESELAND